MPPKPAALILAPLAALLLGGCLARAAVDVATAPVRAVSQAADWATTSQDEADRARGREIRRREEQLGRLDADYQREVTRCEAGEAEACGRAVALRREIDALLPAIPREQR